MERTLQVVTDVQDLADLLQGASVDRVHLAAAGGQMEVVVALTRALLERQEVVQRGLFRRLRTPWTKCELRVSRVASATVAHVTEAQVDHAPVVHCEAVGQGYRLAIQAPDGLQVVVTADQLQGTFADVGHIIETP